MAVTERVLLDYLGEKFSLTQVGQGLKTNQPLIPPLLYVDGQPSRTGQVFVLRTEDLPPASHAECLYLCVGRKPPKACARWMGKVVHVIGSDLDIFTVVAISAPK